MGMRTLFAFGLALCGASAPAHAATCDFSRVPWGIGKSPTFTSSSSNVDAAKNYTLKQPFTVKVGEPVIRRQLRKAAHILTFPQDVGYKSDWFLSPKYQLDAGRRYSVVQESNSQLWALIFSDSTGAAYLFLDKDGHLCDRVGSYYRSNGNWVLLHGNYSAQPDVAAVPADEVDPGSASGIAILLDSLDAVSIGLSIRHMENGVYRDNIKQSFDNLAGVISIQGYQIKVNAVGNGEVSFSVIEEPAP